MSGRAGFSVARLSRRGAAYHWRSYAHVLLAAATTTAVVVGALLVGDSMRGSLVARVEERLGGIDVAVRSSTFFRGELAAALGRAPGIRRSVGAIVIAGSATAADSGRLAGGVRVVGVPEEFPELWPEGPARAGWARGTPRGRTAVIHRSVADDLGVAAGGDILVRFERAADISSEYAFGRRGERAPALRLEVSSVLPDAGPALFDLDRSQRTPRNVFVPLDLLSRTLEKPGLVNCALVDLEGRPDAEAAAAAADRAVRASWTPEDLGLRVRANADPPYAGLESRQILLPAWTISAVDRAARAGPERPALEELEVLTHLANTLAVRDRRIPYSTVSAIGEWRVPGEGPGGTPVFAGLPIRTGEILLNSWAAEALDARPGDAVTMEYWAVEGEHDLEERQASFTVRGIVPLEGPARDPSWTPEYPGISDTRSMRSWDPPFPVDLGRIRDEDEAYWDDHRATPKAFVSLEDGRKLWSSRFGSATGIRVRSSSLASPEEVAADLSSRLLAATDPLAAGIVTSPIRAEGIAAARGSTDFSQLFLALSMFLIFSTLLLLAMTIRLVWERRSREIGVLAAAGFAPGDIRRVLLLESVWVILAGSALGLGGGLAYAALLVEGLRTLWKGAVNAPFLALWPEPASFAVGGAATAALSIAATWIVARRIARTDPRRLLARAGSSALGVGARPGRALALASAGLVAAAGSFAAAALRAGVSPPLAFFGAGTGLLVAGLSLVAAWLGRGRRSPARGRGLRAMARLGRTYAGRAPGRSLVTVALIASATFLIGTVSANRLSPGSSEPAKESGDGGFALAARSAIPLTASLETDSGRELLGLRPETVSALRGVRAYAFRARPGDDVSCLNLYRPATPRLLGAPRAFLDRGGFAWAASMAETEAERANPWLLLARRFPDGAVPAVGDASSVQWILHRWVGDDIVLIDGNGAERKVRIVGLLAGSMFQGDLLLDEDRLLDLFPRLEGDRFFLFESPPELRAGLTAGLEKDLADLGFDVESTAEILASYREVTNTYLATFAMLGWMGLLLGTLGLGAVLARNVDERRGELALLRALGYSRGEIAWIVLVETASLLVAGLAVGAGASLASLLPVASRAGGEISFPALAAALAAIAIAGLASSVGALRSALRAPLIPALREE